MVQYTVGDIEAPTLPTESAESTIRSVLEAMLRREEPQMGIQADGRFLGVVTYRSLSRSLLISGRLDQQHAFLDQPVNTAVSRTYPIVEPDDDLFVLFEELTDRPFVIERSTDADRRIVRDVDFHRFLSTELNEFLIIEDIERMIREMLREEFEGTLSDRLREQFEDMDDLRTPESVAHCSFRHYAIFISVHWDRLEDQFEHDVDFVRELIDRVGSIRNRLFHFRVERESELETDFLEFARQHLFLVTETGERVSTD